MSRYTKELLAELVGKLKEKLDPKAVATSEEKSIREEGFAPISTV